MKYARFVFLAILFFLCSLGANLYFYYIELLEKTENEKEGFAISQSGIMRNSQGNIMTCSKNQINQNISGGKCMDLSYVDHNGIMRTNQTVVIYPNYYVDPATGVLQPVPYGYRANPQQTGYYANSIAKLIDTSNNTIQSPFIRQSANTDPTTSYNPNPSISPQYNTTTDSPPTLPPGKMYFPNGDGTVSIVDIDLYDQSTQYYETATYDSGPRNFLPNYEESTYISKLGSQNVQDLSNKDPIYLAGAPLANTSASYTDIGTLYANDPAKLEATCNKMDPLFCASSNSCLLLGGQKCVSGNKNGPIMKSNYSDYLIINRDYYYYKGKCYGMCPPIPTTPAPMTPAPAPTIIFMTSSLPTSLIPT